MHSAYVPLSPRCSPILHASEARAGSCRANAPAALRQTVARWKSVPRRSPPVVFFSLDPKKRHLQWATWSVFGSSQGGVSEDPKKRHQKLRKPAELRLCRFPGPSALALCLTRESRRSGRYRVLKVQLTDSTGSTPEVPAIASRLTRSIGCGIHIRSSRCSR